MSKKLLLALSLLIPAQGLANRDYLEACTGKICKWVVVTCGIYCTAQIIRETQPLFVWAASNNHLRVVKALLALRADVNAQGEDGNTALFEAVRNNHLEMVQVLLQAGANVNPGRYENRPLFEAVRNNNLEMVQLLLQAEANINAQNSYRDTVLIYAAWNNNLEMVQLLLQAGANVNAQNRSKNTALIGASQRNNLKMFQVLLEAGADINVQNIYGNTALVCAVQNENLEMVQGILSNPSFKDDPENSQLERAGGRNTSQEIRDILDDWLNPLPSK